jgi:hypothetical protein
MAGRSRSRVAASARSGAVSILWGLKERVTERLLGAPARIGPFGVPRMMSDYVRVWL